MTTITYCMHTKCHNEQMINWYLKPIWNKYMLRAVETTLSHRCTGCQVGMERTSSVFGSSLALAQVPHASSGVIATCKWLFREQFLGFFSLFFPRIFRSGPSFSHASVTDLAHSLTNSLTHSLTQSIKHPPPTHAPNHSLTTPPLTHSLTHSFTDSLTHSFTDSLTRPPNQEIGQSEHTRRLSIPRKHPGGEDTRGQWPRRRLLRLRCGCAEGSRQCHHDTHPIARSRKGGFDHAYIRTYIRTYTHTYIHMYVRTYKLHPNLGIYMFTCMHMWIWNACLHFFACTRGCPRNERV